MVQVIRQPSFGGLAGQALGTGLGQGLGALADFKLQQLQQRQQQADLLPGLKALGLEKYAGLPIPLLGQVLKNQAKESEVQRFGEALNLLSGGGGQAVEQELLQILQQPELPTIQQPQANQQQSVLNQQTLQAISGIPERPKESKAMIAQSEELRQNPIFKTIMPAEVAQIAKQAKLNPGQYKQLQDVAAQNNKLATDLRKQQFREQQALEAREFEKHKFSKPEIKAARETASSAKKILHDLERFEELEKEGKLDEPGYIEFLKRSGFDIPALQNPGSEEFAKIAANFIGGAQKAVGGRVSNFELEQFLKTIPNLSQSPQGRLRVIANLKRINRANVEYYNTVKEVLQENKGIPPLDLFEKVDDRIDKKLDKITEQFKKDLAKPVPVGPSSLKTAAQAAAGSALKNIPKALTQGGIGAATGYRFGGVPGALAGATIGGLSGLGGYGISDILSGLFKG